MFLVRLIYASNVGGTFTPQDIDVILSAARKNNPQHNVTGMLCFNANYFLQCLEGSRAAVNAIFSTIQRDARHSNVVILDYAEITERNFSQWSMGYVAENRLSQEKILKYSGQDTFNPFVMQGESAYRLLKELALSLSE